MHGAQVGTHPARRIPHNVTQPASSRLRLGASSARPCARQAAACVAHADAMNAAVPCGEEKQCATQ